MLWEPRQPPADPHKGNRRWPGVSGCGSEGRGSGLRHVWTDRKGNTSQLSNGRTLSLCVRHKHSKDRLWKEEYSSTGEKGSSGR